MITCILRIDYMQVMHGYNAVYLFHICRFCGGHMRIMCWLVVLITCRYVCDVPDVLNGACFFQQSLCTRTEASPVTVMQFIPELFLY